jgi:hypothetical protein
MNSNLNKSLVLFILLFFYSLHALAQGLPSCPMNFGWSSWNNCDGTATLSNGTISGSWLNGKVEGDGKFTGKDGFYYEGPFKNGCMEGVGYAKYPNGMSWKGQFVNCQKQGLGIATFSNGSTEEVVYKDDKTVSRKQLTGPTAADGTLLSNVDENSRYANNKIHLILKSIPETIPKCKLGFRIVNKTNFKLSKNSIIGQVNGANIVQYPNNGNYNSLSDLVSFDSLAPNQFVDSVITLSSGRVCVGAQGSQGVSEIGSIGFLNINTAINDGFKSYDFLEVHNETGLTPQWTINRTPLEESVKLQNPEYRNLKIKVDACLATCQREIRACALRYGNSAGEICGRPFNACSNACRNMR